MAGDKRTGRAPSQMQVEAVIGLMRMAEGGDRLLPNLAEVVLRMIEKLKAVEMRAGLAEAQLENERAKVAELEEAIERLCHIHADRHAFA